MLIDGAHIFKQLIRQKLISMRISVKWPHNTFQNNLNQFGLGVEEKNHKH